jgi:hypothetical protein
MPLGDAAKIDTHARPREVHSGALRIENHVAPVDARQRLVDGLLVRVHALLEVV